MNEILLFVHAGKNKNGNRYKVYRISGTRQYKLYVNGLYCAKFVKERDAKSAGQLA